MTKYNGWENWETWNVALWLGNDEGLYRSITDEGTAVDGEQAESLVRDLMPNGTPDFQSEHHGQRRGAEHYATVDWDEIADAINDMRGAEHGPRD